jgi:hypothetical protein
MLEHQHTTTHSKNLDHKQMVIEKDGLGGLFGRGLRTKILANAVQGIMFSVLWRLGQDAMAKAEKDKAAKDAAAAKEAGKKKK